MTSCSDGGPSSDTGNPSIAGNSNKNPFGFKEKTSISAAPAVNEEDRSLHIL